MSQEELIFCMEIFYAVTVTLIVAALVSRKDDWFVFGGSVFNSYRGPAPLGLAVHISLRKTLRTMSSIVSKVENHSNLFFFREHAETYMLYSVLSYLMSVWMTDRWDIYSKS